MGGTVSKIDSYPLTLTNMPGNYGTNWVASQSGGNLVFTSSPPAIATGAQPANVLTTGHWDTTTGNLSLTTNYQLSNCNYLVVNGAEIVTCSLSADTVSAVKGINAFLTPGATKDYAQTPGVTPVPTTPAMNNIWLWVVVIIVIILIFAAVVYSQKTKSE